MFTIDFFLSIGIGVLVMCAAYFGLRLTLGTESRTLGRTMAVFSAVAGIVVTLVLRQDAGLLRQQGTRIALALIGVLVAVIAVVRRRVG